MEQIIGHVDDGFALFATPSTQWSYLVVVYPPITELAAQVEVSKARMCAFLERHCRSIEVQRISGTADLFVSAVTENEVRELTETPRKACRVGPRHVQPR
jgi:hypothetical protein